MERIIGLAYSRLSLYPFRTHDNLLFLQECSPFWFLTCLFVSYVYVGIIDQIRSSTWKYLLISMFVVGACTSVYLPILLPWSLDTALGGAMLILSGRFIRHYDIFRLIDENRWLLVVILSLFFCFAGNNGWPNVSVRNYGNSIILYFIVSLSATISVAYVLYKIPSKYLKLLSRLGNSSLRIMCIHAPFFIVLSTLNNKYQICSNQNVFAIIEIVVALLCVELFAWILDNLRRLYPQVSLFAYL